MSAPNKKLKPQGQPVPGVGLRLSFIADPPSERRELHEYTFCATVWKKCNLMYIQ